MPQWHGAQIHYSGTPELMAGYVGLAVDSGARIIGGCCGTTPAPFLAMRRALDAYKPGPRPDLAAIIEALGPLVAPPPAARSGAARRREREVNAKAKRRAWSGAGGAEPPPRPAPRRRPLEAPSACSDFAVGGAKPASGSTVSSAMPPASGVWRSRARGSRR